MIKVHWLSFHDGILARGYWDQGLLEDALIAVGGTTAWQENGGIVVVPARHHVNDIEACNVYIERMDWVLVILTGDEEGLFSWRELKHPNMKVWVQTPYRDKHQGIDFALPNGYPPQCIPTLRNIGATAKSQDWFFAGQVCDNVRRMELVRRLKRLSNGELIETEGFTQGLPYTSYMERMARSRVVPCPAGYFTPDTFRLYEALEAGCIPVVETRSHNHSKSDYWNLLFGDHPLPVVDTWHGFGPLCADLVRNFGLLQPWIAAWWDGYKASMVQALIDQVEELRGEHHNPAEHVAVLHSPIYGALRRNPRLGT